MLRLGDGQVECLWDGLLGEEVRALPEDLAALDELLCDPALLAPIESQWQREAEAAGRSVASHGRPTISMQTYVRLIVIKHRTGWGYETLMREVADSLHLRRFCLIALGEAVPDESTIRKRTRRLGAEVVDEITRAVIGKAQRETRFRARAVRIDSTVIEADARYPTDSGMALDSAKARGAQARGRRSAATRAGCGIARARSAAASGR